jgi:hypothetical protein
MLFDRVEGDDADSLRHRYDAEEIDDEGVAVVLDLLDRYGIEAAATEQVAHYHRLASDALGQAFDESDHPAVQRLGQLVARLDSRIS